VSLRVSFVHISSWPVPVHGVASLATVVRDAGHAVQIVDLTFCARGQLGEAQRQLGVFRPQVVCLSVFDELARAIAGWARRELGARILLGGSYPTLFPDEVLADAVVDGVCIGDGEEALCELLARLDAAGELAAPVDGIWLKQGDAVLRGAARPPADLARLPVPDWSLWDVPKYLDRCPVLRGAMFIAASRGCPYACTFCARHTLRRANPGPRYIARPAGSVVEEIRVLRERFGDRGLRHIVFLDHVFGAQPRWLREFCQRYRQAGLDLALPWGCQARAEHVTAEWASRVGEAGCRLVEFGVETVDDHRRYELLNKRTSRELFERAARNLLSAGIAFNVYLMTGVPGETAAELRGSVRYGEQLGARVIFISRFIPVRGTALGDTCRGQGLVEAQPGGEERVAPDRMSELELSAHLWWYRLRRLARTIRLGIDEQGPLFFPRLAREAMETLITLGPRHPLALVSTLDRLVNRGAFAVES
jgi:anaerobic magnesium-protoporphyrin IX monomethyl ester cyclase